MTGILNTTSLSRTAAAALSALLLSGCAALSGGGSEAIPADAMKHPVDLSVVCVLVNEDVKSEPLVKSLETGVRSFGSEPRLLMPGDGPQACSFVVTYEVRTNARAIEAVRFQTFENSVPALEASWDQTCSVRQYLFLQQKLLLLVQVWRQKRPLTQVSALLQNAAVL